MRRGGARGRLSTGSAVSSVSRIWRLGGGFGDATCAGRVLTIDNVPGGVGATELARIEPAVGRTEVEVACGVVRLFGREALAELAATEREGSTSGGTTLGVAIAAVDGTGTVSGLIWPAAEQEESAEEEFSIDERFSAKISVSVVNGEIDPALGIGAALVSCDTEASLFNVAGVTVEAMAPRTMLSFEAVLAA